MIFHVGDKVRSLVTGEHYTIVGMGQNNDYYDENWGKTFLVLRDNNGISTKSFSDIVTKIEDPNDIMKQTL